MALTNAQRQARYRERRRVGGDLGGARLNTWVDFPTAQALKRLAAHKGVSMTEALTKLITDADKAVLKRLADDDQAFNVYLAGGRDVTP